MPPASAKSVVGGREARVGVEEADPAAPLVRPVRGAVRGDRLADEVPVVPGRRVDRARRAARRRSTSAARRRRACCRRPSPRTSAASRVRSACSVGRPGPIVTTTLTTASAMVTAMVGAAGEPADEVEHPRADDPAPRARRRARSSKNRSGLRTGADLPVEHGRDRDTREHDPGDHRAIARVRLDVGRASTGARCGRSSPGIRSGSRAGGASCSRRGCGTGCAPAPRGCAAPGAPTP